ncbi:MAG: DUF1707 domain-containing protein [Rhodococcus sp. (in: high G+C Gram-positive bacteria)]
MADNSPDVRIGNAERERAFSLLSEHYAAGRLGTSEFDERSAAVSAAVTRGELVPLFDDLPGGIDSPASTGKAAAAPVPAETEGRDWRAAVMAVVPIAAVILFFVTGTWLWFLAVPLAGAVFYAGRSDDNRAERRERRRRR